MPQRNYKKLTDYFSIVSNISDKTYGDVREELTTVMESIGRLNWNPIAAATLMKSWLNRDDGIISEEEGNFLASAIKTEVGTQKKVRPNNSEKINSLIAYRSHFPEDGASSGIPAKTLIEAKEIWEWESHPEIKAYNS